MNTVTITKAGPREYYVQCECGYLTRRSTHKARAAARQARKEHKSTCQNMVAKAVS